MVNNVNGIELNYELCKAGINVDKAAAIIGKSRNSFYKKLGGETPFNASEIKALAQALSLSPERISVIFLS